MFHELTHKDICCVQIHLLSYFIVWKNNMPENTMSEFIVFIKRDSGVHIQWTLYYPMRQREEICKWQWMVQLTLVVMWQWQQIGCILPIYIQYSLLFFRECHKVCFKPNVPTRQYAVSDTTNCIFCSYLNQWFLMNVLVEWLIDS